MVPGRAPDRPGWARLSSVRWFIATIPSSGTPGRPPSRSDTGSTSCADRHPLSVPLAPQTEHECFVPVNLHCPCATVRHGHDLPHRKVTHRVEQCGSVSRPSPPPDFSGDRVLPRVSRWTLHTAGNRGDSFGMVRLGDSQQWHTRTSAVPVRHADDQLRRSPSPVRSSGTSNRTGTLRPCQSTLPVSRVPLFDTATIHHAEKSPTVSNCAGASVG